MERTKLIENLNTDKELKGYVFEEKQIAPYEILVNSSLIIQNDFEEECDDLSEEEYDDLKKRILESIEYSKATYDEAMLALLPEYVELEKEYQEVADKLAKMKKEFDEKVKALKEETGFKEKEDYMNALKEGIASHMEGWYRMSNTKSHSCGLKVQERTELTIDEKQGYDWALEHKDYLLLDVKSLKKVAKVKDFDFITKTSEVKVTWPKDGLKTE